MTTGVSGVDSSGIIMGDKEIAESYKNKQKNESINLGLNDFIKLLVAQLQNQDMMNPMQDTEFMAQMAQFSALQAMNTVADTNNTSYAASLVGKTVTVASVNKKGEMEKIEGVVTGVSLFDGRPKVFIGDKSYDLSQIMVVGKAPEVKPPTEGEGDKDKTEGEGETGGIEGGGTEGEGGTGGVEGGEGEGETGGEAGGEGETV